MRLAQGPRISVIATIPEAKIAGPALSAVRFEPAWGSGHALCRAAFLLARTLTEATDRDDQCGGGVCTGQPLKVPTLTDGEIGVLARIRKWHAQSEEDCGNAARAEVFEASDVDGRRSCWSIKAAASSTPTVRTTPCWGRHGSEHARLDRGCRAVPSRRCHAGGHRTADHAQPARGSRLTDTICSIAPAVQTD